MASARTLSWSPSPFAGTAPPDTAIRGVNRAHAAASKRCARDAQADEDRALVDRARGGDTVAFRALVERHERRAFGIALALVRDEHDAREVVQEAFVRVYRGLDRFEGGAAFFTWLYRIVTNLSIDVVRKPGRREAEADARRRRSGDADEAAAPLVARIDGHDPHDALCRSELGARLRAALDALPPYHRGVIVMREIEGMSYEEIAVAMGVSKGTIMSRLFHARRKLQIALADCHRELDGNGGER